MRERFERLYATQHMSGTFEDADSVKANREGQDYTDYHINSHWFMYKMAMFE